jgi:hypothetical protein
VEQLRQIEARNGFHAVPATVSTTCLVRFDFLAARCSPT